MSGVLRAEGKSGPRDGHGGHHVAGSAAIRLTLPPAKECRDGQRTPEARRQGTDSRPQPSEGRDRADALHPDGPCRTLGRCLCSVRVPQAVGCHGGRGVEASPVMHWRGRQNRTWGARASQGAGSSSLPPLPSPPPPLLFLPCSHLCEKPRKGEGLEPQLWSPSRRPRRTGPGSRGTGGRLSGSWCRGEGTTDKWNGDPKNQEPNGWRKSGHQHIGGPGRGPRSWGEGRERRMLVKTLFWTLETG